MRSLPDLRTHTKPQEKRIRENPYHHLPWASRPSSIISSSLCGLLAPSIACDRSFLWQAFPPERIKRPAEMVWASLISNLQGLVVLHTRSIRQTERGLPIFCCLPAG